MKNFTTIIFSLILSICCYSQSDISVIKSKYVFDGENIYEDILVIIKGSIILEIGKEENLSIPENANILEFPNHTLIPGMIEGHSHLLLHPYDETSWNDQVLKESITERSIRAANHAKATLMAGFTTIRDLGAEGAGYADVGVKKSIEKGIIHGPRMIVAGPAIVVTGSYGPKGFADHVTVPLGANEADGIEGLTNEVRTQIGKGADLIKVYADYRWGPFGKAAPTFTIDELKTVVAIANSSGRDVVAHAATAEGMRRATLAGVSTIEHGDGGTSEVFELMKENGVALCPTLAAGDAIMQYRGWNKETEPYPERIKHKRASFKKALDSGVQILAGGDVGVFTHGDNVRELEMMVEYGMTTENVLKSVTSGNADILNLSDEIGRIKNGLLADLIVVEGNPLENISKLRNVQMVMKDGKIYKHIK